MSAICHFEPPPQKRLKVSPIKSISINHQQSAPHKPITRRAAEIKQTEQESKEKDKDKEDRYFYSLHLDSSVILLSTDPEVPCNTQWDIEHDEKIKPNLFIVQQAVPTYNAAEWLKYHLHESNDIENACALLSNLDYSLLIVTGAGMGVDSGLPDYRSSGGFWNNYKGLKAAHHAGSGDTHKHSLSLYDMSKTDWFVNDPPLAWGFYAHRATLYRKAVPHSGFHVLYKLSNGYARPRDYMYMTSNIDGQAIKAGFEQSKIYQTHGSLHHLQCMDICDESVITEFYDGYERLQVDESTFRICNVAQIPRCKACRGLQRPNVSFFTDTNDSFDDERIIEQKEKFMRWLKPFMNKRANKRKKLLVVEVGCGRSVHSLRWECEYLKGLPNVTLIRINPTEKIEMKRVDKKADVMDAGGASRHITLKLPAKLALDHIDMYLNQQQNQQ
eukprot:CAMPEP_0197046540 /NCGR_PEP_ID=MMETSP1384-20130603/22241_1 /TAXON_ID=29189 /ORGANISM="Ammonia sp." /LENGTH=442 /DNA_ID=CAMNT_0042478357 /DNA_START=20 /DNA_END=1348 /DNA_ORIENTATION=-